MVEGVQSGGVRWGDGVSQPTPRVRPKSPPRVPPIDAAYRAHNMVERWVLAQASPPPFDQTLRADRLARPGGGLDVYA